MIPGIERGGERERERGVLPLTSICKEGEEGRKEGGWWNVEKLSNIFVSVYSRASVTQGLETIIDVPLMI